MQTVPVSATPKFAPADRHRRAQELPPQVARARGGERLGLVGQAFGAEPAAEELADLGAVLVDRRHEDVRRPLAGELDDQLGQVGLDRLDAGPGQRLVQADLVGRQRLDLHHLLRPVARDDPGDDPVGLGGVARPVDLAPARDRRFELEEVGVEMAERPVLDRAAGLAERPSRAAPARPRPLGADRLGGLAHVAAELVVAQRELGRVLEPHRRRGGQRLDVADISRRSSSEPCGSSRALPSAGGVRPRCRSVLGRGEDLGEVDRAHPGALAMQGAADVHQARVVGRRAVFGAGVEHAADLVGEHGHRRVGVLDRERAAEPAALLGPRQLDQVDPPDLAESRWGASPTRSIRSEWQVGWYVTRCGKYARRPRRRACGRGTSRARRPAGSALDGPRRQFVPGQAAAFGYISCTIPTHEADGETTTSASPKTSTKCRTSGIASRW